MQQINPSDAQRVDDRNTYIGLHRASPVWPRLPGEKPPQFLPAGCDQQGRYLTRRVDTAGMSPGECCTEMGADDDMREGMGAIVVPAVVAVSLACAALVAFLGGWL